MAIKDKSRTGKGSNGRRRAAWLDALLCLVAMLGIGASLAPDFRQVRTLDYVACDFKTLYASTALYAQGADPYDTAAAVGIYRRDGVRVPQTIFGRMPVYPPMTLLVLAPLAWLPMGAAATAWLGFSLAAFAVGLGMVLREARAQGLGWGWRMVLLGLAVASPVLAFALDIGNVSVAVAGLGMVAWMLALSPDRRATSVFRPSAESLLGGLCLAIALCLKPHVAVWVAIGIALICGRAGRRIAGWGATGFVLATFVSLAVLAARSALASSLWSLAAVLAAEQASGSMSPASRESLPAGAQITSLQSLFGLWLAQPALHWLAAAMVFLLGAFLLREAARSRDWTFDRGYAVLFVSAVVSVGMIATYHRAHDGLALTPVLLWICIEIRRALARGGSTGARWTAAIASLGALGTLLGTWIATPPGVANAISRQPWEAWLADLVTLRQAALAWFCLACWLVWLAVGRVQSAGRQKKTARTVLCPCREASDATDIGDSSGLGHEIARLPELPKLWSGNPLCPTSISRFPWHWLARASVANPGQRTNQAGNSALN